MQKKSFNHFGELSCTHIRSHETVWLSSTVGIYCIAFCAIFLLASLIYPIVEMLLCSAIHFEPGFWSCYYGALWQGFQETSLGRSQIRDYLPWCQQTEVSPQYELRWMVHVLLGLHPYARPQHVRLRR